MSNSLTPTEGARFHLERDHEEEGGRRAIYRTAIYTPTLTYEGTATVADDGAASVSEQLTVDGSLTQASEDLVETLHMLAKLTARSASKKREDGLPPWPARILRWRGPGRGT
jgi:hypothetical protein